VADSYDELKAHFDRIAAKHRSERAAQIKALEAENHSLREALTDLLNVIAADDLIPESVSYMKQARKVLAHANHTRTC
jgi:hypothetical protein